MLSTRMVAAGAIVLFFSSAAAGGAAAQTETAQVPGKPLQLLKIAEEPSKARKKPHAQLLARVHAKAVRASKITTRGAAAGREHPPPTAQVAEAPTPASVWPAAASVAPADAAPPEPAAQPPAAPREHGPGQVAIAGQMVDVAAPDEINELDLAADNTLARADGAAPSGAAANASAASGEMSQAQSKSDLLKDASAQEPSQVGGTAWIAQALAALGGAVAAGSLAWFLIGSAPQRTYG